MAYNPMIGRWMQRDPLGLGPDVNDYRTEGNQPTIEVDPSGSAGLPSSEGCIKAQEPNPRLPHSLYPRISNDYDDSNPPRLVRFNPIGNWRFPNQEIVWGGFTYKGNITVRGYAERRFKVGLAFQNDTNPSNFATFVCLDYEFKNVKRIVKGKEQAVPDFTARRWLTVELVGVFIVPTIENYTRTFKPKSLEMLPTELSQGLEKLPSGHASDKP